MKEFGGKGGDERVREGGREVGEWKKWKQQD